MKKLCFLVSIFLKFSNSIEFLTNTSPQLPQNTLQDLSTEKLGYTSQSEIYLTKDFEDIRLQPGDRIAIPILDHFGYTRAHNPKIESKFFLKKMKELRTNKIKITILD